MSDSEEEDREQDEMLRKIQERLDQAVKKYPIELDNSKESNSKQETKQKSERGKYDNPFDRIKTEEDEDFNDRDFDFITDEFTVKAKSKQNKPKAEETKHKDAKVTFEDQKVSELADSLKERKIENFTHSVVLGETNREDELISKRIKELLNSEESDEEKEKHQEQDHRKEININGKAPLNK